MSLQIWLPLNGNAVNQGLLDCSAQSNNIVYSDGKTGKAASFDHNSSRRIFIGNPPQYQDNFSWCCWCYCAAVTDTYQFILSQGRDVVPYGLNILINSDGDLALFVQSSSFSTKGNMVGKWTHVAVTISNGLLTIYINGIQSNQQAISAFDYSWAADTFTIGKMAYNYTSDTSYFPLNGKICDVRIYNHCLSPKEIHEVYKSLVLHYPLKNTIKKYWNYIWNHTYGIYNNHAQPASLTKLAEDYCGCDIYRLTMTVTDETKLADFQTNLWAHGIYGFSQVFKANTKYCFTILYRPVTHASIKVGGTASNIGGWTALASHYYRDGWYRVGQTRNGTVAEDKTDSIFISFCCSNLNLNEAISIDFCCPCLLEGRDTVEEDDYYEQGFSGEVIDDCSGFGNTGSTVWDTTPAWNGDSIKYKGCYDFNGNDSIISMSNFSMGNLLSNQFTVSFWVYSNDLNDRSIYFGDYQFANGSLFAIEKTASNLLRFWWAGNPDLNISAFPIPDKTWCHVAVTVDVPGSVMKCYKNGDCVYTYTTALTPRTAASHPGIGRDNRTGATAFRGKLSDFRIYATALSESDIQELYSVRASVLTDGTLMVSGEVIEK